MSRSPRSCGDRGVAASRQRCYLENGRLCGTNCVNSLKRTTRDAQIRGDQGTLTEASKGTDEDGPPSATVSRRCRRGAPDRVHAACPWSVRERTFKARTAFPVGPLVRIGGGCMELDGPAIISGGCLSVSAARDATGVSRARDVRKRDVGRNLRVPVLENGWELFKNKDSTTLLGKRYPQVAPQWCVPK